MSDFLTQKQRSNLMSKIRGRNTRPEIALRHALWAMGIRYRLKSTLPGKPDIVVTKYKTAIFVDGCFWHHCPIHGHFPSSNKQFWRQKLNANMARDKRVTKSLKSAGWHVLRLWEHEVTKSADKVALKIVQRFL